MQERRKLATIMAVDMAGYSRAAELNELAATETIRRLHAAIDAVVAPLAGRVFSTAGDGVMIEFATASAGLEAAEQLLAAEGVPRVRIGLHLGEVTVMENGDLLGHGVNVAARLQALAEPATALVSQAVQTQVHSGQTKLRSLGKVRLDKMRERVHVFALAPHATQPFRRLAWRRMRLGVVALFAAIVATIAVGTAWRALAPSTEPPRLAVLRFETMGEGEPYFAEGVADELASYIARMEGIDVIARASSFALSGDRATPEAAAQELDANLVLTGSVRHVGERVRVSAQLAEAPSGRQVWAHEFERPTAEIYLLESEIASNVALAAGLRASAPPARRVDPEAYALYTRAREAEQRAAHEEAATLLEQAITRDADFAVAWSALARIRNAIAISRWVRAPPGTVLTRDWIEPALFAADRAIALDSAAPLPYEVRSHALKLVGEWEAALRAADAAAERGGAVAPTYASLGFMRRAVANARRSAERDPLSADVWLRLSSFCNLQGDSRCGIEAAERAYRLSPDAAVAEYALALHRAGRRADALRLTESQPEAWRDAFEANAPWDRAMFCAMLGNCAPPRIGILRGRLDAGAAHLDVVVRTLAETRQAEFAAELLPRWDAALRPEIAGLYDTRLAAMRRTQAFWDLMEREGILQVWRSIGQRPDFCERERACEQQL